MIDAITAKLVRRFGPSAAEWTAGLPALVADCARRWRLEVGEPFGGGAMSVVIRVTIAGRTRGRAGRAAAGGRATRTARASLLTMLISR